MSDMFQKNHCYKFQKNHCYKYLRDNVDLMNSYFILSSLLSKSLQGI